MIRASDNYCYKVLLQLFLYCTILLVNTPCFATDHLQAMATKYTLLQLSSPAPGTGILEATQSINALTTPTIIVESELGTFNSEVGEPQPSTYQYYLLDAYNFPANDKVRLAVNDPSGSFTISATGLENSFSNTIEFVCVDGTLQEYVFVKYEPKQAGTHSATITHSGNGAETQILTLQGNATAPMPVELVSFKAATTHKIVILSWATASEQNNSHFEIESASDLKSDFRKIGRVNSKNRNSSVYTKYSFEYIPEGNGGLRYFRLKQVDTDGTHTYSKVVALTVPPAGKPEIGVAPNPITPGTRITAFTTEPGLMKVKVFSMSGQEVYSQLHRVVAGENSIALQLQDKTPSGVYIVTTEIKEHTNRLKVWKE